MALNSLFWHIVAREISKVSRISCLIELAIGLKGELVVLVEHGLELIGNFPLLLLLLLLILLVLLKYCLLNLSSLIM